MAGLQPGHVEQIADKPVQSRRGLLNFRDHFVSNIASGLFYFRKRAGRARDGRERRAQFVGNGIQQRVAESLRFRDQPLARRPRAVPRDPKPAPPAAHRLRANRAARASESFPAGSPTSTPTTFRSVISGRCNASAPGRLSVNFPAAWRLRNAHSATCNSFSVRVNELSGCAASTFFPGSTTAAVRRKRGQLRRQSARRLHRACRPARVRG